MAKTKERSMTKLMPEYRRGPAAAEEAAEARKGGGFRSFVPQIKWRDDGESKFILVLTPPDEVGTFDLHEWIPTGTGEKADGETYQKYDFFLSRRDPFIGEDHDRISDDLGRAPKARNVGVGVELEPTFEVVKGRKRPVSFTVKTDTYTRNGDDGEEEVTQPLIGLIIESWQLVWSPLVSLDQSQGPLTDLPIEIIRDGTDQNTRYNFSPFRDMEVDLSPVVDFVDGLSFLSEDIEELMAALEATDTLLEASQTVAEAIFNKWLVEMADGDRYEELTKDITELPDRFGKAKTKKTTKRTTRPARPSQRAKAEETSGETGETSESNGGEPEPAKEDRFAALKARVEGRS